MRQWTTEDRRPDEQYAYWREVICQAYTAVDPLASTRDRFESTVISSECGGLTITRTRSKAQTVLRGRRELRKRMSEEYYLILQLEGNLHVEQGAREALVRPGEFVLVDAAERYRLDWQDWNVLCFAVPHDRLPAQAHMATAVRWTGDEALGQLTRGYMLALRDTAEQLPGEAQAKASTHLTDLLSMGLGGWEARRDPSNAVDAALDVAIDRYLEAHLADPALSVAVAARHFHVSPRTLHRRFEARGTSFTQNVLDKRLLRAAALLRCASRRLPVSEVAERSGFHDLPWFCRAFRRRFGVSASEYRMQ